MEPKEIQQTTVKRRIEISSYLLGWAMILFSNIPNNWQTKTGDNPWSNASSTAEILKFSFLLPNLGISWASECLKRWISENYSCFSSFTPKQVTNLKWWWSMTKCTLYNAKTKISTFGSKFGYFWAPWGSKKWNFKICFMSFSYPFPTRNN